MNDKKLTDAEIVKALECCSIQGHFVCNECPAFVNSKCTGTHKAVLDLINRLQSEIKKLTSGKCIYLSDDETTEYCVEGPCPKYKTEAQIKAEAYKECIGKVEKIICDNTYPDFDKDGEAVNIWEAKEGYGAIDNLLKELVGESSESKSI